MQRYIYRTHNWKLLKSPVAIMIYVLTFPFWMLALVKLFPFVFMVYVGCIPEIGSDLKLKKSDFKLSNDDIEMLRQAAPE